MATPDTPEVPEITKLSRTDKIRRFVRENKTPIACAVTGIAAFAAGRTLGFDKSAAALAAANAESMQHEIANLSMDMRMMQDFIEAKKLTSKFLTFTEEYNGLSPA